MQSIKIDRKQKTELGYRSRTGGADGFPTAQAGRPPARGAEASDATPTSFPPGRRQKRLRVAAYCRVSTLLESQETSIKAQYAHYEQEIRANRAWKFAGVYLEEGVSGTKTEIRPELQRLLRACKNGEIDLILTKSISRFARNTADCLEMVRTLTLLGVHIRFEKERIDTRELDSEFVLSILACLAEDESHSMSGNMKWGIRKRFRDGSYRQPVPPYGYRWAEERLLVAPEQAEVVKDIFAMALSGMGAPLITRELNRRGIPGARGKQWNPGTVRAMLRNPVYMGDALYQKCYTDERFHQRRNLGELDQYYEKSHHGAIVERETFEKVQALTAQRAREVGYAEGAGTARGANRYCFSGILRCGACGAVMRRQPDAAGTVRWICQRHTERPELCRMRPQTDEDIKRAFLNCLNKLSWSQSQREDRLLDVYEKLLGQSEENTLRLAEIEEALEETRRGARKLNAIAMRDRFFPKYRQKLNALTIRERELLEEKNAALINGMAQETLKDLKAYVAVWRPASGVDAFPDGDFTALVERCTVRSGEEVTFHFHCGLALTESLRRGSLEAEI